MNKGYKKRLDLAESQSTKAQDIFEKLEGQFLGAAQEQRQVHDDIEVEIERLVALRDQALNAGLKNQERAQRVRDLFL